MSYLDWNQRVFDRVFNKDRAGKNTSVYIDDEIIYSWAIQMGLKPATPEEASKLFVQDCIKAMRGDPAKVAHYCNDEALVWQRKGLAGIPGYIGMLALLVYASAWGEGSGHLFYGRYWKLTGATKSGMIPGIEQLRGCWKQLERYSEKMGREQGVYKMRTLAPSRVNVGIIVAQGVLRPTDEISLKDIFFDEGADANVNYADQHIRSWLIKHKARLSARALRALDSEENSDYLVARVREELEEWDGEPADWSSQIGRPRTFKRNAFMCFNRSTDGSVYATLRLDFAGRSGDPESVTFNGDEQLYLAHSNGDAVSTPLQLAPTADLDAAKTPPRQVRLTSPTDFQKYQSGEFRSVLAGSSYRYALKDADLRVFVEGAAYGISGYVETFGLKPGYGHIIIYRHASISDEIKKWCVNHADSEIQIAHCVPSFFAGDSPFWTAVAVRPNAPECDSGRYNCLKYEIRPLARLTGGLKLYRTGNNYLTGAPPSITISSIHKATCRINDGAPFDITGNVVHLSDLNLKGDVKITINEVVQDGKESEINLRMTDCAEWTKDRDGTTHVTQQAQAAPPDHLLGCFGGRKGSYIKDAEEYEEARVCWAHIRGGRVMPCASALTIKSRISYMDGMTRHKGPSAERDKSWREAIDSSKLHPAFSTPMLTEFWQKFVAKSR